MKHASRERLSGGLSNRQRSKQGGEREYKRSGMHGHSLRCHFRALTAPYGRGSVCHPNPYRNPFSAIPRSSLSLKPNARAARRYSSVSVQPNMAGSSVFSTIGTPASYNARMGWSSRSEEHTSELQ